MGGSRSHAKGDGSFGALYGEVQSWHYDHTGDP